MKAKLILGLMAVVAVLVLSACKDKKADGDKEPGKLTSQLLLRNDSTVYGLVCDGCTDSVLVLLPSDDSDPVEYEIIDAKQAHKIFGVLKIGDWVGVVLNKSDRKVADLVIDLDQLKGTWCYKVMPQLRSYETMSKRMQRRMMRDMPDSVKQTFLIPREYGFTLKRQFSASPVGLIGGGNSLEGESPVVYPEVPFYSEWHIWNGRLILTRQLGQTGFAAHTAPHKIANDTADFVMMTPDTLVLAFRDGEQGYYRRSNAEDANRKARTVAMQQAQKALNSVK